MIVDTSALIAIMAEEPGWEQIEAVLDRAERPTISAGSWIELATVLVRKFGVVDPLEALQIVAAGYQLDVAPVTVEQTAIASAAYAAYGRGSGHRAKLNFGDCFAYALAKATDEPLLFKGDDFTHTDITPASRDERIAAPRDIDE